nr:probable GTP diphosphokinase RSH2, chloroplastic [Tanacetum cinerariifolium]
MVMLLVAIGSSKEGKVLIKGYDLEPRTRFNTAYPIDGYGVLKMSVLEFPANATVKNVLDRAGEGSYRWSPYGFSGKQELIAKLNDEVVSDPIGKLGIGDIVELTPKIHDKSLIEKREENSTYVVREWAF